MVGAGHPNGYKTPKNSIPRDAIKSKKISGFGADLSNTIKILKLGRIMAYRRKTYKLGPCNELEYTWAGNYGAKGEKRNPRAKPTPEQIEKQNQINREIRMRRLLILNFVPGDYWVTLKYKAGYRPEPEKVIKDTGNFIRRLRNRYKERGQPLKFVLRMEIGKFGGAHIHIVLNEIGGTGRLIAKEWAKVQQNAGVNIQYLRDDGDYDALAKYITKKPKGQALEQISMFEPNEQKQFMKYSCSRNLIRPEPEVKEYSHWTMARILRDGPEPTPGYYIDKSTIVQGINKFTGYSYLRYTERRLEERKRGDPPWWK